MGFICATHDQHSGGLFKSAQRPLNAAVLALIVGISPFYPGDQAQAQKESGVIIGSKEATLKPGYTFKRVSGSKLEVVRPSSDPVAAKAGAVVVVGALECGCTDPKTELFIFCDTVVVGGKAQCGSSSRCTCSPYDAGGK